MDRDRFAGVFSTLPFAGRHTIRNIYLQGREAALEGNKAGQDAGVAKLGLFVVGHFLEATFSLKFGLDNIHKHTAIGDIEAGYNALFTAATASAVYVQGYLACKLGNITPTEENSSAPQTEEGLVHSAAAINLTPQPLEPAASTVSSEPSRAIVIRDRAVTYAAQALLAVTTF